MAAYYRSHGPCVYFDNSSKGDGRRHMCWRAELSNGGRGARIRRRFTSRSEAEAWVRGERVRKEVIDEGRYWRLIEERKARKEAAERARAQRLKEKERQKRQKLIDKMVSLVGIPFEKLTRRTAFQPLAGMFAEIQRRRIELVLNIPLDRRWAYAKLWSQKERNMAIEIDKARRSGSWT